MNEGIERIKELASEIKDKYTVKIVKYLISRKDMNEKYLNEEKSLKQMLTYIMECAKQTIPENKRKGEVALCFDDEDIYSWAIHYWDESNEKLKINEEEQQKERLENEKKDSSKVIPKKKNWIPEGQLTLFDFVGNSEELV